MNSHHKKEDKRYFSIATIVEQLNSHWVLLLIVMQLIILAYYKIEWSTFNSFVLAIDRSPQFMYDFISHYYPMGQQILQNPIPVEGYFYTTFFALLLQPLSQQPITTALAIWGIIQFLCLITLCIFSVRLVPSLPKFGIVLYIGLCMTAFPILHNIKWGQVSIPITLCIIAAFLASIWNKKVLAGVLLGLATAIKLYPLYFIVYFILKRDFRTCLSFGLSVLILYFVFPTTAIGVHEWFEFERETSREIINAGWVSRDINSQYIVHVGSRWFNFIFDRPAGEVVSNSLTVIGYLIVLSCIVCVWLLQQTSSSEKHSLPLVSLFLLIPFVINTSWPHYFVYLPFCQTAMIWYSVQNYHQPRMLDKMVLVLPVLSMLLSSIFFFNLFPDWSVYNAYGILFLSNLFLLVALYILVLKSIRQTNH